MTLLSASIDQRIVQFPFISSWRHSGCCYNPYCFSFASGCLYTGDFDASGSQKWQELSNAYDKYNNFIGCVQIPHHGSRYNYNHQLLKIGNSGYYIISSGEKNKYRHPHDLVIKDILFDGKYPIIVTESKGSTARFIIDNP